MDPEKRLAEFVVRVTIDDHPQDVGDVGERTEVIDLADLCRPPDPPNGFVFRIFVNGLDIVGVVPRLRLPRPDSLKSIWA
ncbi:hypothetical protein LMTR13_26965 [Bradyrhizobium icense]|uniref:Uncharacterized protein n=1 Tax=Bradyrhizobium icense TaxID=1274631 RepID=A0A1B1UKJ1_9BRAD|nr:hypothetical protein LMTR13_26965 [Bradyrhizobium icense]